MEDGAVLSCESLWALRERQFECPCGKSYRSYPALFTHIKNKHAGKPPGSIKKPNAPPKRRGRPPAQKKNAFSDTNVTSKTDPDFDCFSQSAIQTKTPEDVAQMNEIVNILSKLPEQEMDKRRLNEIAAILDLNVYLVSRASEEGSLRVGWVLSEFLQELSRGVEWGKFQQMLTLLMLLVQFTTDSLSNPRLVVEGQVDLLCDHINGFVQEGLEGLVRQYEISHLAIFDEEVVLQLFAAFFQWLIARKYTNYRITLNADFATL